MGPRRWLAFFEQEADRYLDNGFTRNTVAEVDFILRELGLRPGESVLDVGCGTGRHSIELARRGILPTGIDQSEDMLRVARRLAKEAGLAVDLVRGEASTTRLDRLFDHAICLCEGAFSLLELEDNPVQYHAAILANIHSMLKPGGMFLLTALNALRLVREHTDADVESGHFDVMRTAHVESMPVKDGAVVEVIEKGFMPAELTALLEQAGFDVRGIWGGTAGAWNKGPVRLDEIEIMALAQKHV
jgi:2-polyprenyl-3-methyl-5-hydroxy-6-metoxy-1,4-benzoquinol methylase